MNIVKLIEEHKRLIKILISGSKVEQMNEAKKQQQDLENLIKENNEEKNSKEDDNEED